MIEVNNWTEVLIITMKTISENTVAVAGLSNSDAD